MIGVVLATFVASLKLGTPPPETVAKRAPAIVEKVDKQEAWSRLERVLDGIPVGASAPVVLKPAFNGGPGATLGLKF